MTAQTRRTPPLTDAPSIRRCDRSEELVAKHRLHAELVIPASRLLGLIDQYVVRCHRARIDVSRLGRFLHQGLDFDVTGP
jgi:hypothetical protein